MTAEQKIKHLILTVVANWTETPLPIFAAEEIDAAWDTAHDDNELCDYLHDATNEVRCSGWDTGLQCEWSRHYESKAVATQALDGSWIGWTYWYGGGKHGEPEGIDWIDTAYDLTCKEEEKVVTVRTFTKAEA